MGVKTMIFDNYVEYQTAAKNVLKIAEREDKIVNVLKTRDDLQKQLITIKNRLNQEHFRVLVMGQFSAGKSSFINALLGEKILPAKALPATALITEVKYDINKRVIIYPKKGAWKGGDKPFEVPIDKIKEYCLIKNIEDSVIESPFEKMEVFWDLEILKDGVEIIDSPGLNDPNSHDIVTLNYLPNADTIIYVMNCSNAYDNIDKETIEKLRAFQYKSILFVLPYFDLIKQDPDQVEEFVETNKAKLKKLTELGVDGIHFVCSTQALQAKKNFDNEALEESGVAEAQRSLEDYLVRRKGIDKVTNISNQLLAITVQTQKTAKEQLLNIDVPLKEFEDRVKSVGVKLETAKLKADLISRTFNDGIREMLNDLKGVSLGFVNSCVEEIDGWIDDYKPKTKMKITSVKKSAEAIVNEYTRHIDEKMKVYGANFSNDTLKPFITENLSKNAKSMEGMIDDFSKDIKDIKVELKFTKEDPLNNIGKDEGSETATKIAAIIYGLATMDWATAAMTGVFGMKSLLRTLTTQLTAGIIVGIISMFTPIGWVGIIVASIIALITAGEWNLSAMDKDIKKKLKVEYRKLYSEPQRCDSMAKNIVKQIDEKMGELRNEIRDIAYSDVSQIELDIERALDEKKNTQINIDNRKKEINDAMSQNEEIKLELKSIIL